MIGVANGNAKYAREMGVNAKVVRTAGGADYLRTLAPEFSRLLLKTYDPRLTKVQLRAKQKARWQKKVAAIGRKDSK